MFLNALVLLSGEKGDFSFDRLSFLNTIKPPLKEKEIIL
ncbi:MAG: hypothetical protein ACI8YQ_001981 [Polaribacter sp.]|jgi:hypothetical protein